MRLHHLQLSDVTLTVPLRHLQLSDVTLTVPLRHLQPDVTLTVQPHHLQLFDVWPLLHASPANVCYVVKQRGIMERFTTPGRGGRHHL